MQDGMLICMCSIKVCYKPVVELEPILHHCYHAIPAYETTQNIQYDSGSMRGSSLLDQLYASHIIISLFHL